MRRAKTFRLFEHGVHIVWRFGSMDNETYYNSFGRGLLNISFSTALLEVRLLNP